MGNKESSHSQNEQFTYISNKYKKQLISDAMSFIFSTMVALPLSPIVTFISSSHPIHFPIQKLNKITTQSSSLTIIARSPFTQSKIKTFFIFYFQLLKRINPQASI